jgi:hypothetical protein
VKCSVDKKSSIPANATNQTINWTVKDAGTTGAAITDSTFKGTAIGKAVVTATITGGAALGTDYTQDFDISVTYDQRKPWLDGGAESEPPRNLHQLAGRSRVVQRIQRDERADAGVL